MAPSANRESSHSPLPLRTPSRHPRLQLCVCAARGAHRSAKAASRDLCCVAKAVL
ncbi:hypothetical protein BAUCODRAFT_337697 [Baudoinia panamericana UAMH 10762]|uniref:Uncharacterized protein n=1 Tax=Baudoinia panamericana (strain UAMH 10762) TaxID=717646 RepID=M2NJ98_BAUPA|nr:uncharacterized protein BAUCODRAFT_337697 [Baudoinia panamericana UAMH 10762]EMC99469.1 hypothetical protein BAUCODRAFT_337697 [Baudoinia panamericana UAMH 10762]